MSFTSGPYSPSPGVDIVAQNPAAGSGNLSSQAAVIKNVSPYLLSVADGSGSVAGLIDPYTTDLVPLSADTGQQLSITPVSLGLSPAASVAPSVYITWFNVSEDVPGNYPYALPLVSIINDVTTPIPVVTVGGMAYASLTGAGETATPGGSTRPAPSRFLTTTATCFFRRLRGPKAARSKSVRRTFSTALAISSRTFLTARSARKMSSLSKPITAAAAAP